MGILRVDKLSGLEAPTANDFGPNLLYNGDFSKGTDGWSATQSQSVSSGRLTVTNTGTNGRSTSTAFNTEPGESYEISIHNVSTTGQFRLEVREADGSGSENPFDSNNSVVGIRTLRFTATETAHTIVVYAIGGSGVASTYDNITVRKINRIPQQGSVYFDGNDYLSIGAAGDFNFLHSGDNDWTAEFWFKTDTVTRQPIFGTAGSSAQTGIYVQVMSKADGQADRAGIYVSVNKSSAGNYRYWGANDCLGVDTWHHVAIVWDSKGGGNGKRIFIYVDGKLTADGIGTAGGSFGAIDGYVASDHSYPLRIAYNQHSSSYLTGSVSNFRIVDGQQLYTSNFAPLVHGLETIPGTNLICCNNPDSVIASDTAGIGTSRVITANGNPTFTTDNPGLTRDITSGTNFNAGTSFDTQGFFVMPSGTTEQRGRGRGIIAGQNNLIDFIQINTQGNSQDFGDLAYNPNGYAACTSSSTRGVIAGGYNPDTNAMNYITIASTGDAKDFGEIQSASTHIYGMGGVSSNVRGLYGGGFTSPGSPAAIAAEDQIEGVTFSSLGNTFTFGNLNTGVRYSSSFNSSTRGIWAGGRTSESAPTTNKNVIQYVTIATLGNAADFGDLTHSGSGGAYSMRAASSETRGVIAGGVVTPAYVNSMDYVTIATLGNSKEFGDLNGAVSHTAAMSNSRSVVFAGGYAPAATNTMSFVTIATTGNGQDFGDLYSSRAAPYGMSDSHGGIA